MTNKNVDVQFLNLCVWLKNSLDAAAGNSQSDVTNRRFETRDSAPRSLFEALLSELAPAIRNQSKTISLVIEDDKYIVGVNPAKLADGETVSQLARPEAAATTRKPAKKSRSRKKKKRKA